MKAFGGTEQLFLEGAHKIILSNNPEEIIILCLMTVEHIFKPICMKL
jgi:hypothetical protein